MIMKKIEYLYIELLAYCSSGILDENWPRNIPNIYKYLQLHLQASSTSIDYFVRASAEDFRSRRRLALAGS